MAWGEAQDCLKIPSNKPDSPKESKRGDEPWVPVLKTCSHRARLFTGMVSRWGEEGDKIIPKSEATNLSTRQVKEGMSHGA